MSYEFSNERTFELIPEGDYEVILESAEIKYSERTGTSWINCAFRIRDDVEQDCKGRLIYDNIFADKKKVGHYNEAKLHGILLTQGKDGRYKFEDNDEIVQFINGMYMIIHIENKPADERNATPYNQVKFCSYKPTNNPLQEGFGTPTLSQQYSGNIDDDSDLPF